MPYPYTRYRSRNRTRPNMNVPPLSASVAGPDSISAASQIATFPEPMDTTITAVPPGITLNGQPVTGITWTDSTHAALSVNGTFAAAQIFVWPATNVIRGAGGGPTRASTGAMVA